jgi:hypothetical protein
MKVFTSGSCRLLTTLSDGYNKITPIHSTRSVNITDAGINYLATLHNTGQHIQFIKYIKYDIERNFS